MVGGGGEGSSGVNSNTNAFAGLEALSKKQKASKTKAGTSKADVDEEDDEDYYATTAPPQSSWSSSEPQHAEEKAFQKSEIDDDLLGEGDDDMDDHKHEVEDPVPTKEVVKKPVETVVVQKEPERQLSNKENKKELGELEALVADFGVAPKENGHNESNAANEKTEGGQGEGEKKEQRELVGGMMGDFESCYEIEATAEFICSRNLKRIALQLPDHLLKDSVMVLTSLRNKLQAAACDDVRLFVMADTTYGSCCVDEVGAAHIAADCVIHYGHTCLSPASSLPAYLVFGKADLPLNPLAHALATCASTTPKPLIVLFSLEYAYAIHQLQQQVEVSPQVHFAQVMPSFTLPTQGNQEQAEDCGHTRYCIGGLFWNIPQGQTMEDYLLFWIGSDGPAFANVVMTFNRCQIVRYLPHDNRLDTDIAQHTRVLKRRYYLVEKAKDANIVGILVGTLGVAGYLHVINQMKELVAAAGKKAYTFVMGKPNPAKLANFPECDVFIYVSCAETALLDSKEFLSPIITPFEATLAFTGRQWTGEYVMDFGKLITSSVSKEKQSEEVRFSFINGGYVEDSDLQEVSQNEEDEKEVLALAQITEKALLRQNKYPNGLSKGLATNAAEFLAARSYTGLDVHNNCSAPETFVVGKTGRAAGYQDERNY